MRIGITITEKGRQSETFIRNQIEKLGELGEVFVLYDGRLPQRYNNNQLLSPYPFWVLHNITKALTGKRNNFFGNYGVKKYLKEQNINIVLANYGIAGAHMMPVCKSLDIPLAVHFHGFDATQKKILHKYATAYKEMFKYAAVIIAVSSDMKKQLISIGAPEAKVSLVPYGINLKKFSPVYTKETQYSFLSVGRFVEKKSPQSTIKAFAKVKQQYKQAKLTMIGAKTGLYEACEALVKELSLEDDVIFTGVKSSEDIVKYMQAANVFVQHSVTAPNGDMEGTPNTILEASACGLPVVSTKHAGIKEAVISGKTGFLVDEHDIDGMADYMITLIEQPELAKQMGMAGRRHIEDNYDLDKQAQKLFQLLQHAASAT